MNKFDIAKKVLATAAQMGAGTITYSVIKNNVTTTTPVEAVTVAVGSFALGGAVAKVASNHIVEVCDEVHAAFAALRNPTTTP